MSSRMNKILFLFNRSPFQYKVRNDLRQYQIYKVVSELFEVKILCFDDSNLNIPNQQVILLKKNNLMKIINFVIRLKSPRLTHYNSKSFSKALESLIKSFKPDYIYIEQLLMMQYVLNLTTNSKIIFFNDESNLFVEEKNLRGNIYQKLRNIGLAKLDSKACSKADYVLTITKEEEKFLKKKGFKNVYNISYGVDTNYFSFNWEKPEENSILFVGDFNHYPNRQAIRTLINRILPGLSDLGIKLKVVGRNTNRIKNMIKNIAEVFDEVPDVRPYYYNNSVLVTPIFTGAGLRVKILEAALCGIPLIISPIANLGINLVDKEEAFICKSVEEFREVLRDFFSPKFDDKFDGMGLNAKNKVVAEFNETIVKNKIISVFDRVNTQGN